jgi:hypothetical protein
MRTSRNLLAAAISLCCGIAVAQSTGSGTGTGTGTNSGTGSNPAARSTPTPAAQPNQTPASRATPTPASQPNSTPASTPTPTSASTPAPTPASTPTPTTSTPATSGQNTQNEQQNAQSRFPATQQNNVRIGGAQQDAALSQCAALTGIPKAECERRDAPAANENLPAGTTPGQMQRQAQREAEALNRERDEKTQPATPRRE